MQLITHGKLYRPQQVNRHAPPVDPRRKDDVPKPTKAKKLSAGAKDKLFNPFDHPQSYNYTLPKPNVPESTTEPPKPKLYKPTYFVSVTTEMFLAEQVELKALTEEELPMLYKLAKWVGEAQYRTVPTSSDIEIAFYFHTLEYVQKVASGEELCDIVRRNFKQFSMEIMPRNERIKYWKSVAEMTLKASQAEAAADT